MNKRTSILIALILLLISCLAITNNKAIVNASSNNLDDICRDYTATEMPNGLSVKKYAENAAWFYSRAPQRAFSNKFIRKVDSGDYFQNGCVYSGAKNIVVDVVISADDNITKIIPKQLFMKVNRKLYMGKEYGFYINTFLEEGRLKSSVILFDVSAQNSVVDDYIFSITTNVIMRAEYHYVTNNDPKFMFNGIKDTEYEHYCSSFTFKNGLTDAVIPSIRSYTEPEPVVGDTKYCFLYIQPILDVRDISYGATIQNVNSLNYGDERYNIDNDYGYFFIGNEYEFSASKKKGQDILNGIWKVIDGSVSLVIGDVESKFIKEAWNIISTASSIIEVGEGLDEILSGPMIYNATNKNYDYPNMHIHNTRNAQKEAYGKLVKASAITINTFGDDKIYFYDNGSDYAKGTYTFSHTDKSIGKEYSKLNVCVAMKIVENGEENVHVSNNTTFDISQQETHTLNVIQEHNYYMLPNGTMKFAVNPEFGGEYVFDVANNDVELLLDGVVQPKNNGKYTVNLQGNKQQIITLRNNDTKIAIGKITSDCAGIFGSHTIGAGQSRVYKLSGNNRHYILATQNPNVQFTKLFDKNMSATNVFSNATECQAFTYGKDCYVSVKNMSSTQQTINVIAREAETMSTSGKTLTAEAGQKYLKFSFKASTAGNYTFKFDYDENGETFEAKAYTASFDRRTYTVRTADTLETYKVALSANETVNIVIERYTNLDKAWSSNCTVEASPREMWVIEGRETKLNEYLVYRGQHLRLSLKTQYGDVIPVTKDVISDRKYDLTITEGQLIVDIFAQVGVIPLHFIIDTIEYDNNGNPTSGHDEVVFTVHVAINQSVNTETLTHVNDENGVFVSMVDDTYLTQVEITVVNGNNNATTTLKKGTMVDILKLMKYDDSVYATTIKTNRALYKYKDSTGRINTEWVQSHYYWFNIADIETNHLFGDESVDTGINIYNRRHLQNLNKYTQTTNKVFYIQNDIDTKGIEWTPIRLFYGTLYGQNHAIKNLTITIPQSENVLSYYGMFALLYGTVLDLKLESLNFSAEKFHQTPFLYIGGLAGYSHAIISNVTVSGKLTINRCYSGFGGIVGYNEGQITSSVAKNLTMFGNGDMGGIVGVGHAGAIRDCHTENTKLSLYVKTINRSVGGIAGVLEDIAIIERCYNTNTTIKFAGYHNIAWDQIAPHMGIIVGGMSGGTIRNLNVKNTTLDHGDLPEKTNNGNIFHAWHYPRKYIGAYGNGAAGYVENNYTITNTNWNP